MPADSFVQVPVNSTGLKIDTSELVVSAQTVERQRMVVADPTSATNLATVSAAGALKVDGSAVTQPVQSVGNGTLLSGQQAVTASAVALATNACRRVLVKALIGNTINIFVGATGVTTATGFELAPGDMLSLDVTNTNLVFIIASTTGASVSWVATN